MFIHGIAIVQVYLLLTYFTPCSNVSIVNFEQVNVGWEESIITYFFTSLSLLNKNSLQKQPPEVFWKKGVPRNFAKFIGKHLSQSLFLNKVAGLFCNFIKKEALAKVFSCEFCEFSKNIFSTEHLLATVSVSTCLTASIH